MTTGHDAPVPGTSHGTAWDNGQALREGWDLFWVDRDHASGLELQRLDSPWDLPDPAAYGWAEDADPAFANDGHALAFVLERARMGSLYHRAALAAVALLGIAQCPA